jgi:type IV secretion system protein VirB10
MRLSRRAVAIIGLGLGLGLGGSLIWALKSAAPKIAPNLYDTASSAKPGVKQRPTDYSQVTPGWDHGWSAIWGGLSCGTTARQQRCGRGQWCSRGNEAGGKGSTPGEAAALERQQRVRQESDAARSSQLFLGNAGGNRNAAAASSEQASAGAPSGAAGLGNPALSTATAPVPASQAGKRSFMETPSASGVVSSEAVTSASSPYVLQAGSIIPAALITGIRPICRGRSLPRSRRMSMTARRGACCSSRKAPD